MKQQKTHISLRYLLLLAAAVFVLCSIVSNTSLYTGDSLVLASSSESISSADFLGTQNQKEVISTDKGKSKLKVRYRAQYHPFTTWGTQIVSTPIVSFYKHVHTALYFLRLSEVLNKSYLRGPPAAILLMA